MDQIIQSVRNLFENRLQVSLLSISQISSNITWNQTPGSEDVSRTINPSTNILDLPDEILCLIFSYFDATELVKDLCNVCRRFHNIILNDTTVWKSVYFTYFIGNTKRNFMQYVVSKSPGIKCVRFEHPGGLNDIYVLNLLRNISHRHNEVRTLELKCKELATSYTVQFISGLSELCGNTLRHLRMQGTLQKEAFLSISHFPVISTVELSDVYNITGSELRSLCDQCPSLTWLAIPKALHILDSDLTYFVKRKHSVLCGLDLCGFRLSDESIASLCNAPQLSYLSIWDARNLQWKTFSALRTMKQLKFIRLRRLRVDSLAVTSWLVGSCSVHKLNFLDLQYSYYLGEYVYVIISFLCHNLRYLYLGGYLSLSEQTVKVIKINLSNLLVLSNLPTHFPALCTR